MSANALGGSDSLPLLNKILTLSAGRFGNLESSQFEEFSNTMSGVNHFIIKLPYDYSFII